MRKGRFYQNELYACMKFLNNMELVFFFAKLSTINYHTLSTSLFSQLIEKASIRIISCLVELP